MTNKGNVGILRILTSSLFQQILNMQTELLFCLETLNFNCMMLKRVIGTRVPQFLSFCPKLPSVRPHSSSVWSHRSFEVAQLVNPHKNLVCPGRDRTHGLCGRTVRPFQKFWDFACPIQLIPLPMVLVNIINGNLE